jgi:hypothetical protein
VTVVVRVQCTISNTEVHVLCIREEFDVLAFSPRSAAQASCLPTSNRSIWPCDGGSLNATRQGRAGYSLKVVKSIRISSRGSWQLQRSHIFLIVDPRSCQKLLCILLHMGLRTLAALS